MMSDDDDVLPPADPEIDRDAWTAVEEAVELIAEGSYHEAVRELLAVLDGDPTNPEASAFLGTAYYELGDYPRALKAYVQALEREPRHLGAAIGAGHALRQMGELEKALRLGKRALAIREDDPDADFLVGSIYFQRGETAGARRHLVRFLDSRPEAEIALEVQGMLQVLDGNIAVPEDDV